MTTTLPIDAWRKIPYVPYARGIDGSDCWGLVCIVRKYVRGDELPAYQNIITKRGITREISKFSITDNPRSGTLVSVWKNRLCLHIGIVVEIDGRLSVIDSTEARGVSVTRLSVFKRVNANLVFYDD